MELSKRKPPPNWSSRGMQLRLMAMVFGLFVVILLMEKAGNPKNWRWMGFTSEDYGEKQEGSQKSSPSLKRLSSVFATGHGDNSLLAAKAAEEANANSTAPPELISLLDLPLSDRINQTEEGAVAKTKKAEIADGTDSQIWRSIYKFLSQENRETLFEVIEKRSRGEQLALSAEQIQRVRLLCEQKLEEFIEKAKGDIDLAEASGKTQAETISTWRELLAETRQRWQRDIFPLFDPTAEPTIGQILQIAQIQYWLDELALDDLRDNSLESTQSEKLAWIRLWSRLQNVSHDLLKSVASKPNSFAELATQPKIYRARVVQLEAEVWQLDESQASSELIGSERYYRLMLRPYSMPEIPLELYVTKLPDGFPKVRDDGKKAPLRQPISFTGIFYKNAAYSSEQGLASRPVVLATHFDWKKPTVKVDARKPMSMGSFLLLCGVSAGVAVVVAYIVYSFNRPGPKNRTSKVTSLSIILTLTCLCELSLGQDTSPSTSNPSITQPATTAGDQKETASGEELPPWLKGGNESSSAKRDPLEFFAPISRSELEQLAMNTKELSPDNYTLQQLTITLRRWSRNELSSAASDISSETQESLQARTMPWTGKLVSARGILRDAKLLPLGEEGEDFLEIPALFQATIELPSGAKIEVITEKYPNLRWKDAVGDVVSFTGTFLLIEEALDGAIRPIFLGARLEWYPDSNASTETDSGSLADNFDEGLWDIPLSLERKGLTGKDNECFFRILGLTHAENFAPPPSRSADVVEMLSKPAEFVGKGVRIRGRLKQVTQIYVRGDSSDAVGTPSARESGIDSYYQLDLLVSLAGKDLRLQSAEGESVDYSGTFPVTVCVTKLPAEIKVGDQQNLPVEIEGIFYRNWAFRSEYIRRNTAGFLQIAPMVIGVKVSVDKSEANASRMTWVVLVFFATLIGVAGLGYWYLNRQDEKYSARRREAKLKHVTKIVIPDSNKPVN